jgi:hypothetical protein
MQYRGRRLSIALAGAAAAAGHLASSTLHMSDPGSSPNGIPSLFAPIIALYANATRPLLGLLLINAMLGAICIPLLLALVYFSGAHIRRSPIFILVLLDVLLGLGIASWIVGSLVRLSSSYCVHVDLIWHIRRRTTLTTHSSLCQSQPTSSFPRSSAAWRKPARSCGALVSRGARARVQGLGCSR